MLNRLLVVMAISSLWGCWEQPAVESFTRPVKVYEVESIGSVDKSFAAIVESAQATTLAFQTGGEVTLLNVEAGDSARKGVLIAQIDPIDAQLQKDAARARYITSKAEVERYKRLLEKGAVSQQTYEGSYANFISLKSAYEASVLTLENTKLYSPFTGIIEALYIDNYQRVQPTEPIVKIINPDTLEVAFTIAPLDAKLLYAPQLEYFVSFENITSKLFPAHLKRFVDISIGGEGLPMIVTLDNSKQIVKQYGIKAGYSCRVTLRVSDKSESSYTAVPLSSIYSPKGSSDKYVWLYDNKSERVDLKEIVTGELFGEDMVAVKEGLTPGNMIVTAGVYQIVKNQKVKLLK